jgi:hypothetical protein
MKRRDFIKIIAGSAAGWPFAGHAQQPPKWRIGFLHPSPSATVTRRIAAFREGLGQAGEAANAEIVERAANNQIDKLPAMAADLVGQGVQVICAVAPAAVRATRGATLSVPIVAVDLESDPVANGWAATGQHDDLAGVPRTRPRAGGRRRSFATRHWSRATSRCTSRMEPAVRSSRTKSGINTDQGSKRRAFGVPRLPKFPAADRRRPSKPPDAGKRPSRAVYAPAHLGRNQRSLQSQQHSVQRDTLLENAVQYRQGNVSADGRTS